MDGHRFDAWTRRFATVATRRGLLRGAIGGGVATALSVFTSSRDSAARLCSAYGTTCREHATCCSNRCERDARGRKVCQCQVGTMPCRGECVDPGSYQSDLLNCGACGNRCPGAPCQRAICTNGVCGLEPDPVTVGQPCDDGDLCTAASTCQSDGSCSGTPRDCTSQDPCLQDGECDPQTGECVNLPVETDEDCDDGDPCTYNDTCLNGVCVPGPVCPPLEACQLPGTCTNGICGDYPAVEDGSSCSYNEGPGVCCSGLCVECCDDSQCTEPATCGGYFGFANMCGTEAGLCSNDGRPCTQAGEDATCCSGTCCESEAGLTCCTVTPPPPCVADGGLCSGGESSCCSGACCIENGTLVCCTPGPCVATGQPCPNAPEDCCSGYCCEDTNGRSVCCEAG